MLDLAGILFSTVMMMLVMVRAVQRDRRQPWFEPAERKPPKDSGARPWQRKR